MNGRYFRGNGSTAITFLTNSEIETTNPEISTARLGKPERIFYAPLFLSGIPKRTRQTQTGQIGAYILRSAFSVGYSKAHPADSDCANRSVNFTLRFSGHRRQLCGANLENSNQSESENVTAARVNFSREYLALKTRNFVNDVDQRS